MGQEHVEKGGDPPRSAASAQPVTAAAKAAGSSEPAPVSQTARALTASGWRMAKLRAMLPPMERPQRAARGIPRARRSARRSSTEVFCP